MGAASVTVSGYGAATPGCGGGSGSEADRPRARETRGPRTTRDARARGGRGYSCITTGNVTPEVAFTALRARIMRARKAVNIPSRPTKVAIRFLVGFDELAGRTTHRVCRAESGLGARRSLNKFFEAEDWEGPSYQTCRDAAWVADRFESLCDG